LQLLKLVKRPKLVKRLVEFATMLVATKQHYFEEMAKSPKSMESDCSFDVMGQKLELVLKHPNYLFASAQLYFQVLILM